MTREMPLSRPPVCAWFGWRGDGGQVRIPRPGLRPPALVTVVCEVQLSGEALGETALLRAEDPPSDRHLSLRLTSDGSLRLDRRAQEARGSLALPGAVGRGGGGSGRVLFSYSVDASRGRSLLTAEGEAGGGLLQIDGFDPVATDLTELSALLRPARRIRSGAAVLWAGVAVGQVPMALRPGLHGACPIRTPLGYRRADSLRAGDLVTLADGSIDTIIWTGSLRMPAAGSFRPVRLRAPYFGRHHDLIVAPSQRVCISGSDIEYLLGTESVLVEARHLVDGQTALCEPGEGLVSYHGLLLERHGALDAGGCGVESLFLGCLAENPGLLRATMMRGHDASRLPLHPVRCLPEIAGNATATLSALRDLRRQFRVA